MDVEVEASGYAKKRTGKQEVKDLEKAVMGMRITADETDELSEFEDDDEEAYDEEDEEADDDDDDDDEEGDYYEEEDVQFSDNDAAHEEENEKIIAALSAGDKNLKMDKLGNYILDE